MGRKQIKIIFILIPCIFIALISIYFMKNLYGPSDNKTIYYNFEPVDKWQNTSYVYDAETQDLVGIKLLDVENPWGLYIAKEKHPLFYDFYENKQEISYEYNNEPVNVIIQKDFQLGFQTACYFEIILKHENLYIHSIYEVEGFQDEIINQKDKDEVFKQVDILCKKILNSYMNNQDRIKEFYLNKDISWERVRPFL